MKDVLSCLTLVDPPRGGNDDVNEYFLSTEEKYDYSVSPAWLYLHVDMLEHLQLCEVYDPSRWRCPFPPSSRGIDIIHGNLTILFLAFHILRKVHPVRRGKIKGRSGLPLSLPSSLEAFSFKAICRDSPFSPPGCLRMLRSPRSASPAQTPVGGNFALSLFPV